MHDVALAGRARKSSSPEKQQKNFTTPSFTVFLIDQSINEPFP
jgi:hypothetical protein